MNNSNNSLQWELCLDHLHSTPLKARYRGFILHTWATPCQGVCAVPAEIDRAWAKAEAALASLDHGVYHNGKT